MSYELTQEKLTKANKSLLKDLHTTLGIDKSVLSNNQLLQKISQALFSKPFEEVQKTIFNDTPSLTEDSVKMTSLELATLITNSAVLVNNSNCWLNASSIEGDLLNLYHSDDIEDYYDNFSISSMKFKYYGNGKFGLFDEEYSEFIITIFKPLKTPEVVQVKQTIIAVEYFSHWDNDTINTTAELNIETLEVFNIKNVDVDDSYEHLKSEEISIIYNGDYYDFDIEDGELTNYAKVKLSKFIKDRF